MNTYNSIFDRQYRRIMEGVTLLIAAVAFCVALGALGVSVVAS